MQLKATTVEKYLDEIPTDRKAAFAKLRNVILKNIPKGYKEQMTYGMIGYVIPHSIYPKGYHVDPKLPLGLAAIASQKNFVAFYHMGIYAHPELLKWFVSEFPKHSKWKLDMGKSCVRFKKPDDIPFDLIGELMTKLTTKMYIELYEKNVPSK
nr:DUF1801 domain-containing protein [Bacteroidota bacterium]